MGRSSMQLAVLPPPTAGSDWAFTPSSDQSARLVTLTMTLTTSAVVAGRIAHLLISDTSGNVAVNLTPQVTVAASSVALYSGFGTVGALYQSQSVYDGVANIALPALWLPPGWSVASKTTALQADDRWSEVLVGVQFATPITSIDRRDAAVEALLAGLAGEA